MKRIILSLVASAAVGALIAGCSGQDTGTSSGNRPQTMSNGANNMKPGTPTGAGPGTNSRSAYSGGGSGMNKNAASGSHGNAAATGNATTKNGTSNRQGSTG